MVVMSLNAEQRAQTASELALNLDLSGLRLRDLEHLTGLGPQELRAALAVRDADPAHVWLVRDALETAVRDAGESPVPYTVLTEEMRSSAALWLGVDDTP